MLFISNQPYTAFDLLTYRKIRIKTQHGCDTSELLFQNKRLQLQCYLLPSLTSLTILQILCN